MRGRCRGRGVEVSGSGASCYLQLDACIGAYFEESGGGGGGGGAGTGPAPGLYCAEYTRRATHLEHAHGEYTPTSTYTSLHTPTLASVCTRRGVHLLYRHTPKPARAFTRANTGI